MIRNATIPEGVPALAWPRDTHGYLLVPGRKYHKLAQADRADDRPGHEGEPAGQSILAFVEFGQLGQILAIYHPKGWKQCGRLMSMVETREWMPYVKAAKAWLDGVGPATWCAQRTVDIGDGYTGRRVETAPVEGWNCCAEPASKTGRWVYVWTHAETGAVIEDHTYNVADAPARGADAETAYHGYPLGAHSGRAFPTFAQAAAHALTPNQEGALQ